MPSPVLCTPSPAMPAPIPVRAQVASPAPAVLPHLPELSPMTAKATLMSASPPSEIRTGRYERPYCSPRIARSRSRPRPESIDDATREYAAAIAATARRRKARAAELGLSPNSPGGRECGAIEFVVDVPVWSAGCFSDLSTMHALRDTTLAHTHGLIAHLADEHALHASYRLLARRPLSVGWGSVRLAPSPLDGQKRASRRTSFVKPEDIGPQRSRSINFDSAIASDDDESESASPPKSGYRNAAVSDEDENEDEADDAIKAEVLARGLGEGAAFVMSLKDQLTLIMV